ncbi:UNVERIFIED_CONTAM: hypothetical protein Slati_2851900 [Sesamum latifolium]|uniref:Uncharacterized protein n=1 Tax=Sesamum latifolium TaxID=2727402 RepID=A0AAW2VBF3_9LAMI
MVLGEHVLPAAQREEFQVSTPLFSAASGHLPSLLRAVLLFFPGFDWLAGARWELVGFCCFWTKQQPAPGAAIAAFFLFGHWHSAPPPAECSDFAAQFPFSPCYPATMRPQRTGRPERPWTAQ